MKPPTKRKKKVKNLVNPKFKKFVKECIWKYAKCLDTPWHMGDIRYMTLDEQIHDKPDFTIHASVTIDHRYLTADYTIYPALYTKWLKSPELAAEDLAHEVAHIVTHNLHWIATCNYKTESEVNDIWEQTTEIVGRLLYNYEKLNAKKKKVKSE